MNSCPPGAAPPKIRAKITTTSTRIRATVNPSMLTSARVTPRTSPKASTQMSAAATSEITTQSTSGRPVEARNSCPKWPISAVDPAVKHR